ncbi:GvpL/GvpF family gas vesicle protein [Myxococcus sp. K15C18031901]|uniref:GvpL/GvpF family gas vesicle protein n=1 Tax=Myxococcus dinghuensis TaxID=2906761 RepID=UPI0020A6EE90|nr:GvpL/GvpF family gas vesicle protein [Myxococcus dinghuensis]MCP3098150.1 GvpL/GvpF family gas vesicle protein [Myxococcus dinghuensis]
MPRSSRPKAPAHKSGKRSVATRASPKRAPEAKPRPAPERARAEAPEGPRYLYGVVRAREPLDFGSIGLGVPPAQVRAVTEGDLAALVSAAPGLAVGPTRANLLAHQRTTEVVLREHTVLPVAFGTVLPSEAQVRALLRSARDVLVGALTRLEGKVELGLKVLYHREHLARRLEGEDARLKRHADESELEHERRVGSAVETRASLDMAAMLEGLRSLSVASRTASPVGERMLLNAAFLVVREHVQDFDAKVRMLAARSDFYAFRFTGPWAPYSFVDIRLGLELDSGAAA